MRSTKIVTVSPFRFIRSVLQLLAVIAGAQGGITDSPKNSIALKGETKEFTCCSDGQETFFWRYKPVGSKDSKDIYDLNGLSNGFRSSGRFKITAGSKSGCQSLTAKNVTEIDAGTYMCIDKEGFGQSVGWELVILGSFDCEEANSKVAYMGVNEFDLPQDVISTVCISKYFGNMRPETKCEWSSGTRLPDNYMYHRVTETNLTTTSNIQIPARKEFNGEQLSCHAQIGDEFRASKDSATWKSTTIIIHYALFRKKGVLQCNREELLLDCLPQCNYNSGQFTNGSSYCEITYPSETHPKFYVLLHNSSRTSSNGEPPAADVKSKTADLEAPPYYQRLLSEKNGFLMASDIFGGLSCMVCGALVASLAFYFHKKLCCIRRNTRTGAMECCCCESTTSLQVVNVDNNCTEKKGQNPENKHVDNASKSLL